MRTLALALGLLPAFAMLVACGRGGVPAAYAPALAQAATAVPVPSATPSPTTTPKPTPLPTLTPTPVPTAQPTPPVPANGAAPGLIERGPRSSNKVAFTFDMGSVGGATLELLDAVKAHRVHATFFVTGKWAEENPAFLHAIVAAGHAVANHSYSHPDFTKLPREEMVEQLAKTEQVVKRIAAVSTHPYWRPPFGAYDATVLRVAGESGYKTVYWTLDTADWREESTTASITARALKYVEPGGIIVMHGTLKKTALALPEMIQQMQARGLHPTTLSDLLERP